MSGVRLSLHSKNTVLFAAPLKLETLENNGYRTSAKKAKSLLGVVIMDTPSWLLECCYLEKEGGWAREGRGSRAAEDDMGDSRTRIIHTLHPDSTIL